MRLSMEAARLRLSYRPPLDWDALVAFLAARATPGVETVQAGRYRRTVAVGRGTGTIEVWPCGSRPALNLAVRFPDPRARAVIAERVRRVFDLDADAVAIAGHLAGDALLGPVVKRHPGLRAPGAWDGFEVSVRAILGQQVSVAAATTLAGRLARNFGSPFAGDDRLDRVFPTARQLAAAPIESLGVIPARAETIRTLARAVVSGDVDLATTTAPAELTRVLQELKGIGPWTAQYIAMRALGDPDAFLSGDLVLRRMAGNATARGLESLGERWRPWRTYAVMLLWQAARDAQNDMDEVGPLRSISQDARGDRRGSGRGQKHSGPPARRPVSQRIVR